MESSIEIKVEPTEPVEAASESSQDGAEQKLLPREEVHVKCEPVDFDDDEKQTVGVANIAVKVEAEHNTDDDGYLPQSPVKLEPRFFRNEDESLSDDSPSQSEAGPSKRICFDDLKRSWLQNEQYDERFDFAQEHIKEDSGDSDYDTDTSISDICDDEEKPQGANDLFSKDSKYFFGQNDFKWSKTPVYTALNPSNSSDIPPYACRPRKLLLSTRRSPYHIWKYFMNDILKDILKWTNMKIAEIRSHFKTDSRPELEDLDMIELEAFFGILMFGALVKVNFHHPNSIFEDSAKSVPIFLLTMAKDRFIVILNCLQFGDPIYDIDPDGDRNVALLYERALSKCVELFNGSQCAFIMDTPVMYYGDNLPEQYETTPFTDGFKITCLCDSASSFYYSCYIPYVDLLERGFTDDQKKLSDRTQIALLLTKPLHGINKNITCNKKFTSIELIRALHKKKLTCVGTMKKKNKEIPLVFLPSKKREPGSVLYGYQGQVTLMSLMKEKKAVIIASSKHHSGEKADNDQPEILEYYSSTIQYFEEGDEEPEKTTSRRTKLLSMALFYKLLDITMYNTHILLQLQCSKGFKEYQTTQKLAQMLVYDHVLRRAYDVKVPYHLRVQIVVMLSGECAYEFDKKKETCASCPPNRKRKTSRKCVNCHRYLCRKCSHVLCINCNMERAAKF